MAQYFHLCIEYLKLNKLIVIMFRWSIGLFLAAIIAAVIGFGTAEGEASIAAKIFFYVFIVLFICSLFFKPGTNNTN